MLYKYINPADSDGLEPCWLQIIRSYWTDHMKNCNTSWSLCKNMTHYMFNFFCEKKVWCLSIWDLTAISDTAMVALVETHWALSKQKRVFMTSGKKIWSLYDFSKKWQINLRLFAVTRVKFAHDDKSRLACSSMDGKLSVCQVDPPPATVICMLEGHTDGISGRYWYVTQTSSFWLYVTG